MKVSNRERCLPGAGQHRAGNVRRESTSTMLQINPTNQPPGLYWQSLFQGQPVLTPIGAGWFLSYLDNATSALSIGQVSLLDQTQQIVVVRPLNASPFEAAQWDRIPFQHVQGAGYRLLKLPNQAVIGIGTRVVHLVESRDLIGAIRRQERWVSVIRESPHTRAWSLDETE